MLGISIYISQAPLSKGGLGNKKPWVRGYFVLSNLFDIGFCSIVNVQNVVTPLSW
jgi:hypothetical protein